MRARPRTTRRTRLTLALAAALASVSVSGCYTRTLDLRRETPYPANPQRAGVLDIQVIVGDREVTMTNTTLRAFEDATLWLNAWFGARIGRFEPGQTLRVPLTAFADEHGGGISGGGFWASNQPDPIVLAEIQQGEDFFGLVVVTPRDRKKG